MPDSLHQQCFLDLTGYKFIGLNHRFLQGATTDLGAVRRLRNVIKKRQEIALEILNYRRDHAQACTLLAALSRLDTQAYALQPTRRLIAPTIAGPCHPTVS